ncbi:hypothetical protein CI109_105585 [Kwoniella shandongensis]|uniref:Epidermal growth factor receptor-like transmembrane-juxtamembrane segment domain-containing protein n=1 Tax=Kwoniella shandongensis TaxID=1734106 RepID=A0AAJ8LQ16_9TREE
MLFALLLSLPSILAFSFSTSTPTQCGNFTVQWSGGSPPYHLVLVPTITVNSGHIANISIPTDLTSPYSYTFTLDQPAGLEFMASMSDASGWGTGGTTPVLTVGSSSDTSCLPSSLNYDFFFSISPDSNPASCSTMSVSWDANATEPVYLYGMIPHGTAFQLPIDYGQSTSYVWNVDIAQGTQFLLLMADAGQYQTGGSTQLYTVQNGGTTCINSTSPSASGGTATTGTSSAASSTASVSGVGGSSSGGNPSSSGGSKKTNTGAIAGGAVGGVAFLVLLALLLFCCLKRRTRNKGYAADPAIKSYGIAGGEKGRRSGGNGGTSGRNTLDLVNSDEHVEAGVGAGLLAGQEGRHGDGNGVEMNGNMYEPSPFRYPSPPNTPGGQTNASPGMVALASEKATQRSHQNHMAPSAPFAAVPGGRPGSGTYTGTGTGTGTDTRPSMDSVHSTATPPGVIAPTEASNQATVGHGSGPGRMSSIRKTPSTQQLPSSPAMGAGLRPSLEGGAAGSGEGRRLPELPSRETETRFVQHEDAGVIVDLPPRYDQLRTRNPDQA